MLYSFLAQVGIGRRCWLEVLSVRDLCPCAAPPPLRPIFPCWSYPNCSHAHAIWSFLFSRPGSFGADDFVSPDRVGT